MSRRVAARVAVHSDAQIATLVIFGAIDPDLTAEREGWIERAVEHAHASGELSDYWLCTPCDAPWLLNPSFESWEGETDDILIVSPCAIDPSRVSSGSPHGEAAIWFGVTRSGGMRFMLREELPTWFVRALPLGPP